MAVIFAFIKSTYYVSSKYTTDSSVNYSNNNRFYCHLLSSSTSISYIKL
nr:MAG TPA: hypothetical protein [Caudoviricetes sp.]DAV93010.1 MAG TPA: hypothetical protein [Bacteriophage sp.]